MQKFPQSFKYKTHELVLDDSLSIKLSNITFAYYECKTCYIYGHFKLSEINNFETLLKNTVLLSRVNKSCGENLMRDIIE